MFCVFKYFTIYQFSCGAFLDKRVPRANSNIPPGPRWPYICPFYHILCLVFCISLSCNWCLSLFLLFRTSIINTWFNLIFCIFAYFYAILIYSFMLTFYLFFCWVLLDFHFTSILRAFLIQLFSILSRRFYSTKMPQIFNIGLSNHSQ